ncbi:hypothetical protein LX32DRAFT_252671 [Colletotrichum zoysiae]|uniref:Uncharacterized protein n=1 Tax=Colletotrichum zoysiae TaxID=1216348 RepID=A0AAD9HVC3_9PEZI|nr:hypothetical protein LX32DRAFT_252671 [Colletotrichum zoysiae]
MNICVKYVDGIFGMQLKSTWFAVRLSVCSAAPPSLLDPPMRIPMSHCLIPMLACSEYSCQMLRCSGAAAACAQTQSTVRYHLPAGREKKKKAKRSIAQKLQSNSDLDVSSHLVHSLPDSCRCPRLLISASQLDLLHFTCEDRVKLRQALGCPGVGDTPRGAGTDQESRRLHTLRVLAVCQVWILAPSGSGPPTSLASE